MRITPDPKKVQNMLGHASAAMALDVYADLYDRDIDEVGSAMDSAYGDIFSGSTILANSLPKTQIKRIG